MEYKGILSILFMKKSRTNIAAGMAIVWNSGITVVSTSVVTSCVAVKGG